MSLSTSMMTNPFLWNALQGRQTMRSADSSCTSRTQMFQNLAQKTSGAAIPDGNSMNFGQILFGRNVENTAVAKNTDSSAKSEEYLNYLKSKYGNLTIKSVGKDQKTLDRLGKTMSGSDVIIAPNIVEQMANDPEKAAYYERKIDAFFEDIPRQTAIFAAKGLDYQPCGVVVHEDGSVTYIGGCADSPERVAQVNAINKAKREKEAAERKAALERSQEAARAQQELMERYLSEKALIYRFGKGQ